jgi:hypothetical protein
MQLASNLSSGNAERIQAEYDHFRERIDSVHKLVIEEIITEFSRLGDLTKVAFDCELNRGLVLFSSVVLAEAHGVESKNILRTTKDVDNYMLS